MSVSIYTIAYNEELMVEFFVRHYRSMFPQCNITVFDNYSTDRTKEIAESLGCKVIQYDTNNKLSDAKYLEIKNNCWKYAPTDWVLICDMDEIMYITESELLAEQQAGTTIIKGEGYNMYNLSDDPDNIEIEGLQYGLRATQYDKNYLFNKKFVKEINYFAGCHTANPKGTLKYSTKQYRLLHFKALGENYVVARYRLFGQRMSEENIKNKWGGHYLAGEEIVRRDYRNGCNHPDLTKVL